MPPWRESTHATLHCTHSCLTSTRHLTSSSKKPTSNETVRVQGEIYIPSSNNKVDSVAIFIDGGGSTTQIGSTLVPTADQWVAFDVTGQVSGAKIHFRAKDGGTFTIEDTGGDDVFYLANVTVDATQSSGYVSKWYDQSGNGRDMAQIDTDDQPRIVNSGTLETLGGKPTVKFLNVGTGLGSTFLERGGITGQTEVAYFGVVSLDNADVTRPTFVGTGSDFAGTSAEKLTLRYNGSSTFTSGESIPTGELVSIGAVVPYKSNTYSLCKFNISNQGKCFYWNFIYHKPNTR